MRRGLLLLSLALMAIVATPLVAGALASPRAPAHVTRTDQRTDQPAGTGQLTPVHVTPGSGGRRTTFHVTLRLPSSTTSDPTMARLDSLTVSGPHRSGCVSAASKALPAGAAGSSVAVALNPSRLGGRWCAGTFNGVITETQSPICDPGPQRACPMFVIAPRTIARFKFRVTG